MREDQVEHIARATHEVNRAYCLALGDDSQLAWDDAPQWQRTSAINGVIAAIAGASPRQSHEGWMAEKKAMGWGYGPVKNPDRKEHPCMVPYDDLPAAQRQKDQLFVTTARAMAAALGCVEPPPHE